MTEPGRVVFVVDDDASIRDSLRDLIDSAGLDVQTSAQEFFSKPASGCCVITVSDRSLRPAPELRRCARSSARALR